MKAPLNIHDRIFALWDSLVDFPASRAEEALHVLMQGLCALMDAQNAMYFGTVRVSNAAGRHPVKCWRVHRVSYLHETAALRASAKQRLANFQRGEFDLIDMRNAADAGSFRVHRLCDVAPPEWFDTPGYLRHYRDVGLDDALWAGIPVNNEVEVYFAIFRNRRHPAFSPADRDALALALRGLKWFHRQLMLSRGVMAAASPLTDTEQLVVHGLLAGLSEKQIAQDLGQSPHTTHSHVRAIFRKFGVNNRASLLALWLGNPPSPP